MSHNIVKTKFVSTPKGTRTKKNKLERTPSEEILSQEIPDGITIPSIDKEKLPPPTEEFSFYDTETTETTETKNTKRKRNPLAKSRSVERLDESLLELPPISGRQRKRNFTVGYDADGAMCKFKNC